MYRLTNAQPRVLVVDDNVDAATTLVWFFSALEINAQPAFNGMDALSLAEEFMPNFIFLDLDMPGISGYEVAQLLRKKPSFAFVTIVALTGRDDVQTRNHVATSGFNLHLVKPANPEALMSIMRDVTVGKSADHVAILVDG